MKHLFNKLILISVIVLCLAANVQAAPCNCGYIKKATELRGLPNRKADVVVNLGAYDQVEIKSTAGSWYGVKAIHAGKQYTGYVKKSMVKKENKKGLKGYIAKAGRLYKKKNGKGKITEVSKNDPVVIKSWYKNYLYVQVTHKEWVYNGWINGLYYSAKLEQQQNVKPQQETKPQQEIKPQVQPTQPIKYGYVNWWRLNLRKQPSTAAEIVIELSANDRMKLLSYENYWYKVEAEHEGYTYEGFVWCDYVADHPLNEKEIESVGQKWITENEKVTPDEQKGTGFVNYKYLRLRENPNTNSSVIIELSYMDPVFIYEIKDGWYRVDAYHDGSFYKGWVAAEYITAELKGE